MSKHTLLAGVAAVALAAAVVPARADNIVTNTWYAGQFTTTGTPLLSGGVPGTNGPILPAGSFANGVSAPGGGAPLSLSITLPNGGWLTVTDVEASGDRFMIDVNGVGATPAVGNPSGLTPGGQQAVGSDTSVPVPGAFVGENIAAALSNPAFSSGTFILPAGASAITITGIFLGTIGFGDMDLIVEPSPSAVPEPATLSILGIGLASLGLMHRRRRRARAG